MWASLTQRAMEVNHPLFLPYSDSPIPIIRFIDDMMLVHGEVDRCVLWESLKCMYPENLQFNFEVCMQ